MTVLSSLPLNIAVGDPNHIDHHDTIHAWLQDKTNVSHISFRPVTNDGIQFASAAGNNANDGFSFGSAKLTAAGAIAALPVGGGRVEEGVGTFGTASAIAIPPLQGLRGQGIGTVHSYTGHGAALSVGNAALNTALSYGNELSGHKVLLTQTDSTGVTDRETAYFSMRDVLIEGNVGGTNVGFLHDGGKTSNLGGFFENVVANHVKVGFTNSYTHATGQAPTSTMYLHCFAQGDTAPAGSIGFLWSAATAGGGPGAGNGSLILGGNTEHMATGIYIESSVTSAAGRISVFGHRFESNTTDVFIGALCKATAVVACQGLDTYNPTTGVGFDSNLCFGNFKSDGSPLANIVPGSSTFRAFAVGDVPLIAKGATGQTGDLFQALSSAGAVNFAIDAGGEIVTLGQKTVKFTAYTGSPEGVVTAGLGSYCADVTNGEGYIKKVGTGNTGWKLITHA